MDNAMFQPRPTAAMQFLDSVHIVLVQNLFWWTVMCSSLAILLRFFIITSLAELSIKPRVQSKTDQRVRVSAAAWVVLHGGGCSGGDGAQRGCNFLVSSSGEVTEGRGWGIAGSTNNNSVDIYLIGDYQDEPPPDPQVAAVQQLIAAGVSGGHVAADYKLVGHRQVQSQPPVATCPGDRLYALVQQWPRYAAHVE